jgi:hypothetical protein
VIVKVVHTQVMPSESKMLTFKEFASLLTVGNTSSVFDPPAAIPAEHSAKLIALGYMVDLEGRLRMTTTGRSRIYAGQLADQPVLTKDASGASPRL